MIGTIHGIIGRNNTGDEIMAWQHAELLRSLGCDEVRLSTVGVTREIIDNLDRFSYCLSRHLGINVYYYAGWSAPDILLIGGGTHEPSFGLFEAAYAKARGALVARSSCSFFQEYYDMERDACRHAMEASYNLCDAFLLRDESNINKEKFYYVQDIASTYHVSLKGIYDKVALVTRHAEEVIDHHSGAPAWRDFSDLRLDFPFDVLVLTQSDRDQSKKMAEKNKALLYDFSNLLPTQQADLLCRYKRVISLGRLHPAIYGKANGLDTILVPVEVAGPEQLPPERLWQWEELKEAMSSCCLGKSSAFNKIGGDYCLKEYKDILSKLMKKEQNDEDVQRDS